MEIIFGSLIHTQIEVKFHFTSLHFTNSIQDQRLLYHDQGGDRDFDQEPNKCLSALFSLKIGKSTEYREYDMMCMGTCVRLRRRHVYQYQIDTYTYNIQST